MRYLLVVLFNLFTIYAYANTQWIVQNQGSLGYAGDRDVGFTAYYGKNIWISSHEPIAFVYDMIPINDNYVCAGVSINQVVTVNGTDLRANRKREVSGDNCVALYTITTLKGKEFIKSAFEIGAKIEFPTGSKISIPPAGDILNKHKKEKAKSHSRFENAL